MRKTKTQHRQPKQPAARVCSVCWEWEKDAFGHKQYKKAGNNQGTCLACAEVKRNQEHAEFAGNRACSVCQEMKAEDAFGHREYKKAGYSQGTCFACAETKRNQEYEEFAGNRKCSVCQEMKGEDAFGHKQYNELLTCQSGGNMFTWKTCKRVCVQHSQSV